MVTEVYFSDQCTIKIGAADAGSSTLTAVTSYITGFNQSGGGRDTESKPLFGGANFTHNLPRAQFEVSVDVIIPPSANSVIWDNILMNGTGLASSDLTSTSVTSDGESVAGKLEFVWTDGTTIYTRSYNNIYAFEFTPEQAADGELKGSMSFKMAPTDSAGVGNLTVTKS